MPPSDALVSVVIPCFNQAACLRDAIAGALAQTHTHVEMIVVDDGSTDDTYATATLFGVSCIRQDNRGLSHARNRGLRASCGDFIIFCDADDRLPPTAVVSHLERLEAHPHAVFSYGRGRLVAADLQPEVEQALDDFEQPLGLYARLLAGNVIFTPGVVMIRRTVFDRIEPFIEGLDAAADYDLWLRLAREFTGVLNPEVVLEYRQHDGSMSSDLDLMQRVVRAVLERQRPFLADQPVLMSQLDEGLASFVGGYERRWLLDHICKVEAQAVAS